MSSDERVDVRGVKSDRHRVSWVDLDSLMPPGRVRWAIALVVCAGVIGGAGFVAAFGSEGSETVTAGVVRARQFVLTDEAGNTCAILEHRDHATVLSFVSGDGGVRVRLSSGALDEKYGAIAPPAGLTVFGPAGSGAIQLNVTTKPKAAAFISVNAEEPGASRILLTMSDGQPSIAIVGEDGKSLFESPSRK